MPADSTDPGAVTHGDARSAAHSLYHTDRANHDKLRRYIDQQESALTAMTAEIQQLYAAFEGSAHSPKNPREATQAIEQMAAGGHEQAGLKLARELADMTTRAEAAEAERNDLGQQLAEALRLSEERQNHANQLQADLEAEQQGRLVLRKRYGARDDETFDAFLQRALGDKVSAGDPPPEPAPAGFATERAWLIERTTPNGPRWALYDHDAGKFEGWVVDASRATRYELRDDALDVVPLVLEDDEDYPCQTVTVTEHEWPPAPQPAAATKVLPVEEHIVDCYVDAMRCTVRDCLDCGCLVPGGPTRCKRCAREVDRLERSGEGNGG